MRPVPLFSVVIPAHNEKERLAATLDSIAAADFDMQALEVVVVDDGSTDGTYEMFRERSYPFDFRIERVEYASQSRTTNEAIGLARGTYVLSSAQDILFEPTLLRKHLDRHEQSGSEDTVVLGYLPYPPQLEITPFMFYLINGGFQFAYFMIRDRQRVPPNFLYAPNFSVRRDVLERVGAFDERFPYGCQDSDLGIRLVEAGARIVFEPEAVGYHNHPITIEQYCGRQRTIGKAILHLERKHPDYEGGTGIQDLVIAQYLMCSDTRLDHARQQIGRLQPLLSQDEHAGYQELWNRTFCRDDGSRKTLTPDESATFKIVQELFGAFHLILGFHLSRGYLEEALKVDGVQRVGRWVRCRASKGQASIQVQRTMQRRLHEHGIDWDGCSARDYRISTVVTDLANFEAATRFLEPYQNPPAAKCNHQLVLVLDDDRFTEAESERLEQVAEVVVDRDRDRGVLAALELCRAEVVMVASSDVEHIDPENDALVDKLFQRIPELCVLSGGLETNDGKQLCGHAADGAPLIAEPSHLDRMIAVDAPIRELCCMRGSVLAKLLEGAGDMQAGVAWHQELGARLRRDGKQVWHVPDLRVRATETEARARPTVVSV